MSYFFEGRYLNLLQTVLVEGEVTPTRAVLKSTGQHVATRSVFAPRPLLFDLSNGIMPLMTTKKVNFRAVAAELLWFISGSTNVRDLQAMGCHLWDAWADEDGSVGPSYGYNWRHFGGLDGADFDQLEALVEGIRAVRHDPHDSRRRRLMLTALDPSTVHEAALFPCHFAAQWHVGVDGSLSCQVYQRSADLFLGVPFNIASYALLTHLLANACGMRVGSLTMVLGDAHIYENHLEQVDVQVRRTPRRAPTLELPELTFGGGSPYDPPTFLLADGQPLTLDVLVSCLKGYDPHPALPGEVAV